MGCSASKSSHEPKRGLVQDSVKQQQSVSPDVGAVTLGFGGASRTNAVHSAAQEHSPRAQQDQRAGRGLSTKELEITTEGSADSAPHDLALEMLEQARFSERLSAERQAASARSSFACEVAAPKPTADKHKHMHGEDATALTQSSVVAIRNKALQAVGVTPGQANGSPHVSRMQSYCGIADPLPGFNPPNALTKLYTRLGIIPADTPVPLSMLQRLWGLLTQEEVIVVAQQLAELGVVRLATLEDGSVWALADTRHLEHIQARYPATLKEVHVALLNSYSVGGTVGVANIKDDGYILQALTHHLMLAEWDQELRSVLMNPVWLENKLHAYGVSAIVADFRRYLSTSEDSTAKLLLQAFQLSLGATMEHPSAHLLREQMLARLMAVGQAPGPLRDWYEEQQAKCAADGLLSAGHRLVHLVPRTPTLTQAGGLLRMTMRGHTAPVRHVIISPNGQDIVTVSDDGTAQVWDMNVGDCVLQLTRDTPLTAVAVSPDSRTVVVGAADGTACAWDLQNGQVSHSFTGHHARINAIAIDRQGLRCATASDDHVVRVWSMYDGSCEMLLMGHGDKAAGTLGCVADVAISSDGTLCLTASDDTTARVWDLDEDGELMHVLEGHGSAVASCAFVGTSHRAVTGSYDATLRVWDTYKGKCLYVLSGHEGRINRVVCDSGGSWAISSSDDFTARVWELDTGKCLQVLSGHGGWIIDATLAKDGCHAVTASGDCRAGYWDVKTGKLLHWLEGHGDEVRAVALTARARFAVTASDDATVRLWDLQASAIGPPPAHEGRVHVLQALPSGNRVVSSGEDGRILLWDAISGDLLARMAGHKAGARYLRVSDNGMTVATGSGDRRVCKWNWSNASGSRGSVLSGCSNAGSHRAGGHGASRFGKGGDVALASSYSDDCDAIMEKLGMRGQQGSRGASIKTSLDRGASNKTSMESLTIPGTPQPIFEDAAEVLQGQLPEQQGSRVKHMAFDASCTVAAVVLFDSTVSVWDIAKGTCIAQLIKRGERDAGRTHSGGVNAVYLTKDGRKAVTISKDCTARIWDVTSAECLVVVEGHTDGVVAAALSSDETLLATTSYDKMVRITSMADGRPIAVLDHAAAGSALAFSPDDRRLAVVLEDNTTVVWDLHQRTGLPPLVAHKGTINACVWSPDGIFLATASQDCTLRVWRASDGAPQAFFMADAALTSLVFAGYPANDIIALGDVNGVVHFLDFSPELQHRI